MPDPTRAYHHEAVLYAGIEGFIDVAAPFVRAAIAEREPVLVVVSGAKIRRLTAALGRGLDRVEFADMDDVGANPARIIPYWHDFIERHAGRPVRGIGEPVHELRTSLDLVECMQHEALLNVAIDAATPLRLMCPYDTSSLGAAALQCALRTHPVVVDSGVAAHSPDYDHDAIVDMALSLPLADVPGDAAALDLLVEGHDPAREFVAAAADRAGLGSQRCAALLIAAREAILAAGPGSAVTVRTWHGDGRFTCEVADQGVLRDPLVGRRRPTGAAAERPGLWLANELCDLVQLRSSASGTIVRLHVTLPGSVPAAAPLSS